MALNFLPYTLPLYHTLKTISHYSPSFFSTINESNSKHTQAIHEIAKRVLFDEHSEGLEYAKEVEELLFDESSHITQEAIEAFVDKNLYVYEREDQESFCKHSLLEKCSHSYAISLSPQVTEEFLPYCIAKELSSILREDILSTSTLKSIVSTASTYLIYNWVELSIWTSLGISFALTELSAALYSYQANLEGDYFAFKHCIDEELEDASEFLEEHMKSKGAPSFAEQIYESYFLKDSLSRLRIQKVLSEHHFF